MDWMDEDGGGGGGGGEGVVARLNCRLGLCLGSGRSGWARCAAWARKKDLTAAVDRKTEAGAQ